MSSSQLSECGHCTKSHKGGKKACNNTGPHRGGGLPQDCQQCARLVIRAAAGIGSIGHGQPTAVPAAIRPAGQQQQVRPARPQQQQQRQQENNSLEVDKVITVPVAAGIVNQRVVFDTTQPIFVEMRRQYGSVTMSSVTAQPVVAYAAANTGDIIMSFTTDRETSHQRADIIGRVNYAQQSTNIGPSAVLVADLEGMHASRHVDPVSRAGKPGLVMDFDSTSSIAFTMRILVRLRCADALSETAQRGPIMPSFPTQVNGTIQESLNVRGLFRLCVPAGHRIGCSQAGILTSGTLKNMYSSRVKYEGNDAMAVSWPAIAAVVHSTAAFTNGRVGPYEMWFNDRR
ncbi:hypothetical protein L211DRAFT_847927 [Terfezia boudieri ATCC MYA-4762]|uniref:Uncharacterized protein n=1 Tax=Terfezia boudieri ATCC MYA-4762 TaxID=1051890 RepID=A0A3N4M5Y0_9PEZI|nr:hypothetical protein L211DRAFT_847927 [Terfezia boudieri ATCC MYA-4762]